MHGSMHFLEEYDFTVNNRSLVIKQMSLKKKERWISAFKLFHTLQVDQRTFTPGL